MTKTLAFILAGGKGERLGPLTKDRAKPAVPFGGIYRLIDFPLSNCINSGLRRIYVLPQYKSDSLEIHLRLGWTIFNMEMGEFILSIPPQMRVGEDWYRGTADAVYQNIYTIEKYQPRQVLILAADHIYKMNYAEMLNYHKRTGADVTVAAIEVPVEKARHFGILSVGKRSDVSEFTEKPPLEEATTVPGHPGVCLASMGVYIFNTQVLCRLVEEDARSVGSQHDFGRNVFPSMIDRYRVFAYEFIDENRKTVKYWRDVGTLDAYWEANMDLVGVDPLLNLYDRDWPLRTYQPQLPPAKTVFAQEFEGGRRGQALDSIISAGCIVSGGRVNRSVLSPGVRVNSYSDVSESVLMHGVEIGRYCRIRRAIIEKDVSVPPGTQIGYDLEEDRRRFVVTAGGITVVSKGAELRVMREVVNA
ncbi:MAG: glucose-1-phosphate adenylyltransferase [Pseudomonadota bacterium]